MQIGLATLAASSRHYSPDSDTYNGLRLIAEAGIRYIEYNDQSVPSYWESDEAELRRIRACAEELGLTLWSAHSPCGDCDLAAAEPPERREALDIHRRCIDGLAVLGIPHFVIHQVGGAKIDKSEKTKYGAESVAALRPHAQASGVRLLIENFTHFDAHDLLAFLEAIGPDGLGIVLDTGHEHQVGRGVPEAVRLVAPHLVSLHAHDNHGADSGQGDEHLPPGYGTTDWPATIAALRDVEYAGPFMMEVIPHKRPLSEMKPRQVVRACAQAAREVLAHAGG